jgi:hypothetical protein
MSTRLKSAHGHDCDWRVSLDGSTVSAAFEAKDYIWSPADYTPWAQRLIAAWKLTPAARSEAPGEFLVSLTDAKPETLVKESKRVSEALTKAPLDAALHEQAAMLTTAFALREASGIYYDTRRELCRAAAHLAIARALQPPPAGTVGALAEATLHTLAGRETAALSILEKLPSAAPGVASWTRALRVRNTGNWQLEIDPTVPLEMVESFRARAANVGSHFAILWLEKVKPGPLHDWRRIVVENEYGVEDGHRFAYESVAQELAGLAASWKAWSGSALTEKEAIKALTAPAERAVTAGSGGQPAIDVLGWDFWSAQHQRHFCEAIWRAGVPRFPEIRQVELRFARVVSAAGA